MSRELIAVINSDDSITLEWNELQENITKDKEDLQNEIFARMQKGFHEFLLYLGFCNKNISLSASLDFFRTFCGLFSNKLIQTPNLESLREKVEVSFSENDKVSILNDIPFITGSEHINENFIEGLWLTLNKKYQSDISVFKGTVDKYIKQYRPDVHLAGRIYFHLVESKKEEYPFAFLATYSTEISSDGKSKHVPLKHALSRSDCFPRCLNFYGAIFL